MDVCVFGDSVAKGVVYDEEKDKYTFLKDNFVSLIQSVMPINIKNYAKFGCTVTKGAEIMEKQGDKISEYQYTILEFGGNDCDLNWPEVAASPDCEHGAQVPIDLFKECYEKMIEKARTLGSKPILLSLPPLDSQRFFKWVSKDLNKKNIMTFLGNDVNFIYRWHESYNSMIYDLATEYKIPVIDIRKDFLTKKDYRDFLCIDGMHPNEKGHKLIASSIEKAISSLL